MEFTLKEIKPILKYIIENNETLEKNGQKKISIAIEGSAGQGKTAIIEQIAHEYNANFIKINLAQITEPGD